MMDQDDIVSAVVRSEQDLDHFKCPENAKIITVKVDVADIILAAFESKMDNPLMTNQDEWQPIDTAPKGNISFDVEVMGPSGQLYIIPDCRFFRTMLGGWEIRGSQNKVSPYFTICRWRKREQAANTGP